MYGPSARMRLEQEEEQRSNSAVVITSILSLLVVVAAVAIVGWLVLRSPESAVDSAERLEPVGTALPAPTEQPALPTPLPTEPPIATEESADLPAADDPSQPEAPEEPPAVVGLPTVASEELNEPAGPTPTPRVIAQPTEIPSTPVPAAPTLPPSIPVTEVPVVALQPVEEAPLVATRVPVQGQDRTPVVTQPTPAAAPDDDDPFNIFDEVEMPRIDPAQDPMERVREMQEDNDNGVNPVIVPTNGNGNGNGNGNDGNDTDRRGRNRDDRETAPVIDVSTLMPTIEVPTGGNNDGPAVASMPDVDAMIDEITASTIDRVTNPNTNPNVGDAGRRITSGDDDDKKTPTAGNSGRRKATRAKDRTTQPRDDEDNTIVPGAPRPGSNSNQDDDCSVGDPGFPFCN